MPDICTPEDDCTECNGVVRPGTYCAGCGRNDFPAEDQA